MKENKITTLQVLELLDRSDAPFTATVSEEEFRIFKELSSSDFITGHVGPDTMRAPRTMVSKIALTSTGRLLMEQLKKESKQNSAISYMWKRLIKTVFPSKKQFKDWTLPSKASYLGAWIGLIALLIGIRGCFLNGNTTKIETGGDFSPGVVGGDYVAGDVTNNYLETPENFSNVVDANIIEGLLPVVTKRLVHTMKWDDEEVPSYEYGIYLILEVTTRADSVNLSQIVLEGDLLLSGNEYVGFLSLHEGKPMQEITREFEEKMPYHRISWVTSSPQPKGLGQNENALVLFKLCDGMNQSRSYIEEFVNGPYVMSNYLGYKNPSTIPKWENTYPNVTQFVKYSHDNNKFYISGIRDDFIDGSVKWFLKVGNKRMLIPADKIQTLRIKQLSKDESISIDSLEEIYYRTWY